MALPSFQPFGFFAASESFNFVHVNTVVDIASSESSLGSFNEGRFVGLFRRRLVDLRILVLLFGGLGLFEYLLRRGELLDRLRRRRALQVLVRIEAADRSDVIDVRQLNEVLLTELRDAVLNEAIPVLALLVGDVALASVVSAVEVPAAVFLPELSRHRRQSDALGYVRERVNELATFRLFVVKAAAVAILAFLPRVCMVVLARHGLEVGVDGA